MNRSISNARWALDVALMFVIWVVAFAIIDRTGSNWPGIAFAAVATVMIWVGEWAYDSRRRNSLKS